ncbi:MULTISPECIES: C40 family peptidase [Kitasatospora]|uniref:C40 family peptidase n=1 Tax=Kitasatospora cystarginea TaxID=58350 RepID=A0ABN3E3S7_9ACTN
MGNHRRPKPAGRARMTMLAATAGAATVLPVASAAHAAPSGNIEQVKAQVDKLYEEAEVATEKFNKAGEQQQQLQAETSKLQDRLAAQQARINELQSTLGAVAADQYRSGGVDPSVQLILSASPDEYLQRAGLQDQANDQQVAALRLARQLQLSMDQTRNETAAKLAELDRARQDLAERKQEAKAKLAEAQSILGGLEAADRAKVLADGNDQAASRGSGRTSPGDPSGSTGGGSSVGGGPSGSVGGSYTGPASGRAKSALDFAYAQIGKPYQPGGVGPSSFDCSGLTQSAWRTAGVSLPRTTWDQWNAGHHVSQSDLQPGDLVFYFQDLHHVGIYVGDGKVLHAPRLGKNVQIVPMNVMPYMGAIRP